MSMCEYVPMHVGTHLLRSEQSLITLRDRVVGSCVFAAQGTGNSVPLEDQQELLTTDPTPDPNMHHPKWLLAL